MTRFWTLIWSLSVVEFNHEKYLGGIFMKPLQIIGGILLVFAIADFGLSWVGINLTPFLPPEISRFSPIVIGLIGGALLKAGD